MKLLTKTKSNNISKKVDDRIYKRVYFPLYENLPNKSNQSMWNIICRTTTLDILTILPYYIEILMKEGNL